MRLLFLLLLYIQSFLATSDSSHDPNMWNRGRSDGESCYKVHATDATKTNETEALLKKSTFGADNVITEPLDDDIPTWMTISHRGDLIDAINEIDVVRVGEPRAVPQLSRLDLAVDWRVEMTGSTWRSPK
jgi:hypothetical protein